MAAAKAFQKSVFALRENFYISCSSGLSMGAYNLQGGA